MKVAFILERFPPETNSAAIQMDCLAEEYKKNDYEVKIFTTRHNHIRVNEGVYEVSVPFRKSRNFLLRTLGELLLSPLFFLAFYKNITRFKPDIIIFYSPPIFLGLFVNFVKRGSRTILILRDIFPEWASEIGLIKSKIIFNFFRLFSSYQYNIADFIAYESDNNLKHLEKYNIKKKLFRLDNWLAEKDKLIKNNPHKYVKHLLSKKIVIYAGTIGYAQNIDNFKNFCSEIKNQETLHFLILGQGKYIQDLKRFLVANKIKNVSIEDPVSASELEIIMSDCSFGYLSLQDELDNIPGKFILYLRAGIPVYANVGVKNPLNEIISKNNIGVIDNECNSDGLKQLKKLEETDLFNEYSLNCRKLFEMKYSAKKAFKTIEEKL